MKLGRRDFIGGVAAAMVLLPIAGGGVEQGMGTAAWEDTVSAGYVLCLLWKRAERHGGHLHESKEPIFQVGHDH